MGLSNKQLAEQIKSRNSPDSNSDNNIFVFVKNTKTLGDTLKDDIQMTAYLDKFRTDGLRLQIATYFLLFGKDDTVASRHFASLLKYIKRPDVSIDMLKNIAIGYLTIEQKARLNSSDKDEFHDYIVKRLAAVGVKNIDWK
jgi:hypothetical protein